MLDKPNAMHTLGLEKSNSFLRGVGLTMRKGQPVLEHVFEADNINDPASLNLIDKYAKTEKSKNIVDLVKRNLTITCLNTSEVLVRFLELKLKRDSDIDEVLPFQIEPLLPYPVENAIVDWIKLSQSQEGTLLTFLVARKDHIRQHLEFWQTLHIEPEVISCVPAALAAFSKHFFSSANPHFVLHLGLASTTCALIHEGKLLAAQFSANSIDHLKKAFIKDNENISDEAIQEQFKLIDYSKISSMQNPHLSQAFEQLRMDLTRILYALAKQTRGKEVTEILAVGDGGSTLNLFQALSQNLSKTILVPQVHPNFAISIGDLQKYSISIGAALSGLPKSENQVNFRQQEFVYPNPWKRFKQPLTIYLTLCVLAAIAFYFFGESYLKYQEDELRKEYVDLLVLMNKPYKEFEAEYALKFPSEREDGNSSIQLLTQQDLLNRLNYIEKDLQSMPETFPLLPNVPRVSDILAWLSIHPKVVDRENPSNTLSPSIQIDSFSYTLVKRPDQTKKQEKYQVKVEIEFSAPTPKMAREFHDALIAPNDIVDPKGEVKWSSNRGKYRTSFYLKDKTIYPSAVKP